MRECFRTLLDDDFFLNWLANLNCLKPSEKEKQSCFNPHIILKSTNGYRISHNLVAHDSLTTYLTELEAGKRFEEMDANNNCKYYECRRVEESCIGKNGERVEYTITARVDISELVHMLVPKLLGLSKTYLKHRTYVDNLTSVFPLLKESYTGKFIELDFSQNLSLRPKDEVQSAHFSRRQFTLYCAIVEPGDYRYHYHISNDTKHDPIFFDQVIRDVITKYNIRNKNLWIQSDNAPTQYKTKHAFRLYQNLADEFGLRVICTYGAAGHGKGVIGAMSRFGAKNILRHDIITRDVFFNDSEAIVDYLAKKKPEFCYTNVSALEVVTKRLNMGTPLEIKDCNKQHIMVCQKGKAVVMKEYLCDCDPCRQFDFDSCEKDGKEELVDLEEVDDCFLDEDLPINQEKQVFDFVEIPLFVTVFTGVSAEPLYFLKIVEKGISNDTLSNNWRHVILPGLRYFTGYYLKPVPSRSMQFKKFELLPLNVFITADEVYDTYVEINSEMLLDVNVYNELIQKTKM